MEEHAASNTTAIPSSKKRHRRDGTEASASVGNASKRPRLQPPTEKTLLSEKLTTTSTNNTEKEHSIDYAGDTFIDFPEILCLAEYSYNTPMNQVDTKNNTQERPLDSESLFDFRSSSSSQSDTTKTQRTHLTPLEATLWAAPSAATMAAARAVPGPIARRLGVIVRRIEYSSDKDQGLLETLKAKKWLFRGGHSAVSKKKKLPNKPKPPNKTQTRKDLKAMKQLVDPAKSDIGDWVDTWSQILRHSWLPTPLWEKNTGVLRKPTRLVSAEYQTSLGFSHDTTLPKDSIFLSYPELLRLLDHDYLVDPNPDLKASCYNGLNHTPIGVKSILKAIAGLSTPSSALYNQPMIVSLPILQPISSPVQSSKTCYELRIAIYAHRLLFEIMTQEALEILMAAIHPESYHLQTPLQEAPGLVGNPESLFASAPYPQVVTGALPDKLANQRLGSAEDTVLAASDETPKPVALASTALSRSPSTEEDYVDAFSISGFLKLIENQGSNISKWPHLNTLLQGRLQVELLLHQIHGLCWMHDMEEIRSSSRIGGLTTLFWEERCFPDGQSYFYSPALGQVRLQLESTDRKNHITGGILSDEMGLGKTVQVVALIIATKNKLKEEAADQQRHNADQSACTPRHSTLIVVPAALVSQWVAEVRKIAGETVTVDIFDHKDASFYHQMDHGEDVADIVITTYKAFGDASVPLSVLESIQWGRIVLDEMQEIRSWTKTISKGCQKLQSRRRWMLSGTPITESIDDFKGELCFLGLEPFAASNDDGFFNFAISKPWEERSINGLNVLKTLSLIMLRRSKSMTIRATKLPILGLKPLTVTFEPIPQDDSERALYCFVEYLLHATTSSQHKLRLLEEEVLSESDETATPQQEKNREQNDVKTKTSFLTLLRNLCVSPFLLNGGLGCASTLANFNSLNKDFNQLQTSIAAWGQHTQPEQEPNKTNLLSCVEAIRFLSQIEDKARTDADFVTDVRVGGGEGVSRRDRAMQNPEELLEQAKARYAKEKQTLAVARSKRAKARWHLALEGVTTGHLPNADYHRTTKGIMQLWQCRFVNIQRDSGLPFRQVISELQRGWRPSARFLGNAKVQDRVELLRLFSQRNQNYLWARPFAIILSQVPPEATEEDVQKALRTFSSTCTLQGFSRKSDQSRQLIVHMDSQEAFDDVMKRMRGVRGIHVPTTTVPQWIQEKRSHASKKLEEARAETVVRPCAHTTKKMALAQKELDLLERGIIITDKRETQHVVGRRALGTVRDVAPRTFNRLLDATKKAITESTETANLCQKEVLRLEREINRLLRTVKNGISDRVEKLNTFESLQALERGDTEMTFCPICHDALGNSDSNKVVALTRCGHLTCRKCLQYWMQTREDMLRSCLCVECRKPVLREQVVFVDPGKQDDHQAFKDKQEVAKALIIQAANRLENNDGRLESHLWEALYLAIELPEASDRSQSGKFTAIPGNVLGHLRKTTGISINHHRHSNDVDGVKLSSKVRVLLEDLPKNELSVVFASSKATVQHLVCILEMHGIGCRGLFNGQTHQNSERALSEWHSEPDVLVLVVQSGAAACGLTLTAARKMFLMEPFLQHEEEKQAYARLHRFGQTDEVNCKVYYAPVSIESRLLEWRKRASGRSNEDENTVFAPLRVVLDGIDNSDDAIKEESSSEESRTQFLLGLNQSGKDSIDAN